MMPVVVTARAQGSLVSAIEVEQDVGGVVDLDFAAVALEA